MSVGDKIKALRKKHFLTQDDFASKIGVSRLVVSEWENDQLEPTGSQLLNIIDVFGESPDYFSISKSEKSNSDIKKLKPIILDKNFVNNYFNDNRKFSKLRSINIIFLFLSPMLFILLWGAGDYIASPIVSIILGALWAGVFIFIYMYRYKKIKNKMKSYEETLNKFYKLNGSAQSLCEKELFVCRNLSSKMRYASTFILLFAVGFTVLLVFSARKMSSNNIYVALCLCAGLLLLYVYVFTVEYLNSVSIAPSRLLKEDNFSYSALKGRKVLKIFSIVYWISTVAIYAIYKYVFENYILLLYAQGKISIPNKVIYYMDSPFFYYFLLFFTVYGVLYLIISAEYDIGSKTNNYAQTLDNTLNNINVKIKKR